MNKQRKRPYASLSDYLDDLGRQGKTQADFAAEFGISVGYLSDLKNGKVSPSLKLAKRLSDECNIPVESFIVGAVS